MSTIRALAKRLIPGDIRERIRDMLFPGLGIDLALGAWCFPPDRPYKPWYQEHRASPQDLAAQRADPIPEAPFFSIIVPLYNTPRDYLDGLVASVLAQSYGNFELILVDSTPNYDDLAGRIAHFRETDPRIVEIRPGSTSHGIVANTNAGVAAAQGDFVCFMDHDDLLEPDALYWYAKTIAEHRETDALYCDEDIVKVENGSLTFLHALLKPDYSPELLACKQYILHLFAARREILEDFMPLSESFEAAQDYEITLQACERARRVEHIPRVLYHWREGEGSTAANPAAKTHGRRPYLLAGANHLRRLSLPARLVASGAINVHNPWFDLDDQPSISLVVACDGSASACWFVEAFEETNSYRNVELLLVGPGIDGSELARHRTNLLVREPSVHVKALACPSDSTRFERWNAGAAHASGTLLAFTVDTARYITPHALEQLVGIAQIEGVGLAAPKTLYADMSVHCYGIAATPEAVIPLYRGVPHNHGCYQCDAVSFKNFSAASTLGCAIARNLFETVGGFDVSFKEELASVDLCARIRAKGLRIVQTPTVRLQLDNPCPEPRLSPDDTPLPDFPADEVAAFDRKWPGLRAAGDPFFNPNLDQAWGCCAMPRRKGR